MSDEPLDQSAIEALIAAQLGGAGADPEPAADAGGSLSQAQIEAILAGGSPEEAAAPPHTADAFGAAAALPTVTMPAEPAPVIEDVAFDTLYEIDTPVDRPSGIEVLMDVPLSITVELGQATVTIRDLLDLGQGSILRLNRHAGEPVDVLVNGRRLARAEVVVMEEDFGIRVTDVVSPAERLRSMGE
jgi:flagellar motor switch protein FliN/FliY